jgi:hypothetical protein
MKPFAMFLRRLYQEGPGRSTTFYGRPGSAAGGFVAEAVRQPAALAIQPATALGIHRGQNRMP